MSKSDSIKRHHLIIQKIRKRPMGFQDLADYLQFESALQDYDFTVSQRTFQRDLKDIRKIYNIDIQFDRSAKVYKIEQEHNEAINERIFEAYDTFNALNLTDKLSKYIHFEYRKPQGTDNLHGLLHAIKKEVQINFIYRKFDSKEERVRWVEPYALKEHRSRWYVLALDLEDENNTVKSFGLDRLSHLEITRNAFVHPKDYNVNTKFKHCFGIVGPNAAEPHDIILSFTKDQAPYIESMPLHESQEILEGPEDEFRIKLKLFITYDLEMELRSYGERIKVIQPQILIDKLKKSYQKSINNYD